MPGRTAKQTIHILFLADVVGPSGVAACRHMIPRLVEKTRADLVVVNVENAAAKGVGVKPADADAVLEAGAHCLTSGNHIWKRGGINSYLKSTERLLRPANHRPSLPGVGRTVLRTRSGHAVGVVNLQGRAFMSTVDHPFDAADRCLHEVSSRAGVVLVDFHAETTSEKAAMAHYLDGRVSAVVGTHTHVQTADERILPGGTAFITDAGMVGPYVSVIGVEARQSLDQFRTGRATRFTPAGGVVVVEGVRIAADAKTGRATAIKRVRRFYDPDTDREVDRPF